MLLICVYDFFLSPSGSICPHRQYLCCSAESIHVHLLWRLWGKPRPWPKQTTLPQKPHLLADHSQCTNEDVEFSISIITCFVVVFGVITWFPQTLKIFILVFRKSTVLIFSQWQGSRDGNLSVCWLVDHFGADQHIAVFCTDIHGPKVMYYNDFANPLTFYLVASSGKHLNLPIL